jgi:hypothetical protein
MVIGGLSAAHPARQIAARPSGDSGSQAGSWDSRARVSRRRATQLPAQSRVVRWVMGGLSTHVRATRLRTAITGRCAYCWLGRRSNDGQMIFSMIIKTENNVSDLRV